MMMMDDRWMIDDGDYCYYSYYVSNMMHPCAMIVSFDTQKESSMEMRPCHHHDPASKFQPDMAVTCQGFLKAE